MQILEEVEERTDFLEGQTNGVEQMGDGEENLDAEFAATENSRNFAVLTVGSTIDFVGDEDCSSLEQPPDRPDVGQVTQVRIDAGGIDQFTMLGACHLLGRGDSAATFLRLRFLLFRLAAFLLALFFGSRRKGLIELCRGGTDLLFEFSDTFLRRL